MNLSNNNNNIPLENNLNNIPMKQVREKRKGNYKTLSVEDARALQVLGMAARERKKELKRIELLAPEKEAVLKIAPILFPNITKIVKESGISRATFNKWLNEDEKFKGRFDDAIEEKLDEIEESLFETAKKSQHASLTLPILKAFRRERYNDDRGSGTNNTQVVINIESPFSRPNSPPSNNAIIKEIVIEKDIDVNNNEVVVVV